MVDKTHGLTTDPNEVDESPFRHIKLFEGTFASAQRKKSQYETRRSGKPAVDQAEVVFDDVVILAMDEGYEAPELKDDKLTFWYNFAEVGKDKPVFWSDFRNGFAKSAKELQVKMGNKDGTWENFLGQRCVMEKKVILLFAPSKPKEEDKESLVLGPDKKYYAWRENFVFSEGGNGASNITDYAQGLLVGCNATSARRTLRMDGRVRSHGEFLDALTKGLEVLAEMVGLEVNEEGVLYAPDAEASQGQVA